MKPAAALIGAALLLSGCATLSPSECRVANWREQGAEDGSRGQPARPHRRASESPAPDQARRRTPPPMKPGGRRA